MDDIHLNLNLSMDFLKILPLLGGVMMAGSAEAAIVATFDNFTTNTLAGYTSAGGYTMSYVSSFATDFGDGANEGVMSVAVAASDNTGLVSRALGTIDLADVGSLLTLTFSVSGQSTNFHGASMYFTTNSTQVGTATTVTGSPEWDAAGTAPLAPATTIGADDGAWRQENGVVTVNYTIQAGDVGKTLGWNIDSTGTSGGGFNYRLDNWNLAVVPEPSVALLGGLGVFTLLRRRRA